MCNAEAAADTANKLSAQHDAAATTVDLGAEQGLHALVDAWYQLLGLLYDTNHFQKSSASRDVAIQQHTDVKAALTSFARARPDVIFGVPRTEIIAVAEVALLPREGAVDRKLRSAHKRLQHSFVLNGATTGGPAVGPATTQDLLRVVHDFALAPEPQLERHAAGLTAALKSLVMEVRAAASRQPDPEALALAQQLAASSTHDVAAQHEAQAAAKHRKQAERDVYLQRKHLIRLRTGAGSIPLAVGDWFCAGCGSVNFRRRSTCIRCEMPERSVGNTVVTEEDVIMLYGTSRLRPQGQQAAAAPAAGGNSKPAAPQQQPEAAATAAAERPSKAAAPQQQPQAAATATTSAGDGAVATSPAAPSEPSSSAVGSGAAAGPSGTQTAAVLQQKQQQQAHSAAAPSSSSNNSSSSSNSGGMQGEEDFDVAAAAASADSQRQQSLRAVAASLRAALQKKGNEQDDGVTPRDPGARGKRGEHVRAAEEERGGDTAQHVRSWRGRDREESSSRHGSSRDAQPSRGLGRGAPDYDEDRRPAARGRSPRYQHHQDEDEAEVSQRGGRGQAQAQRGRGTGDRHDAFAGADDEASDRRRPRRASQRGGEEELVDQFADLDRKFDSRRGRRSARRRGGDDDDGFGDDVEDEMQEFEMSPRQMRRIKQDFYSPPSSSPSRSKHEDGEFEDFRSSRPGSARGSRRNRQWEQEQDDEPMEERPRWQPRERPQRSSSSHYQGRSSGLEDGGDEHEEREQRRAPRRGAASRGAGRHEDEEGADDDSASHSYRHRDRRPNMQRRDGRRSREHEDEDEGRSHFGEFEGGDDSRRSRGRQSGRRFSDF